VVLVRVSRLYKERFRVKVIPCSYWHVASEHDVKKVVVDGATIEVGEGNRVYIEAVEVRVVGDTAEIRSKENI